MPQNFAVRRRTKRGVAGNAVATRNRASANARRTRDLIVEQAKRTIADHGVDGLKLTSIAKEIGIRQPSIYAHFRNRDEILREMGWHIIDDLMHLFDASEGNSPRETILLGLDDLLTYIEEHPAEARLIARDMSIPGGFEPLRAIMGPQGTIGALEGPLGPMIQRLQRILDKGSAEGSLRPFQAPVLFPLLLGTILLAANTRAIPSHQLHIVLGDLVTRALLPVATINPAKRTSGSARANPAIPDRGGPGMG